jgi:hypothetical protein
VSRNSFPTEDQIRFNFKWALKAAADQGIGPPSDNGFDLPLLRALRMVAQYSPNPSKTLVQKAKDELEKQITAENKRIAKHDELVRISSGSDRPATGA